MKHFSAPWGRLLRWTSIAATLICIGVSTTDFFLLRSLLNPWLGLLSASIPLLILAATAPFVIRGYAVEEGLLRIRRLWWDTRIPLSGLRAAAPLPNIMRRSLRLCGNGGLYSFTGWYRNKALGNYRAYVTDLHRTVVLRFDNRTIVVSPDHPAQFAAALLHHSPPPP
jgi:hypothetical protein